MKSNFHGPLVTILMGFHCIGPAHDVCAQLRNKYGLPLDFSLFFVILKSSGRETSQN